MDKRRILLVAGDAIARSEMEQFVRPLAEDSDCFFYDSYGQAGAYLVGNHVDAVVADVSEGASYPTEFLSTVARLQPNAVHFLVTDKEERTRSNAWIGTAIQYLPKKADPNTQASIIERSFRLGDWMRHETIRKLAGQIRELPSHPTLYTQLLAELKSPDCDLEEVALLISQDPAMCAKMLKVVNSAFFGLVQPVCNSFDAVMFLGIERTRALILFTQYISLFRAKKSAYFSIDDLWNHSLTTASFARWIVQTETHDRSSAEEAFTAGLLHDLGKLMLMANLAEVYEKTLAVAHKRSIPCWDAERETLGTTHEILAACLLGLWGLPLPILGAVAGHHRPALQPGRRSLLVAAVHVANGLAQSQSNAGNTGQAFIDHEYLDKLGLKACVERWREVCLGQETNPNDSVAKSDPSIPSCPAAAPRSGAASFPGTPPTAFAQS